MSDNNSPLLILTTTVNVNRNKSGLFQKERKSRIETYIKSVKQWLENTNFNIIIIENSGYDFNEEFVDFKTLYNHRFEVISFAEHKLKETAYLRFDKSKGTSELYAINYAFYNSSLIKKLLPKFIIKITGRYYISELEDYLKNYNLDEYDCLTQYKRGRCEMVGTHIKNFKIIFDIRAISANGTYNGHVEDVYRYRTSQFNKILICKMFNIEPTQRGGINQIFSTI